MSADSSLREQLAETIAAALDPYTAEAKVYADLVAHRILSLIEPLLAAARDA